MTAPRAYCFYHPIPLLCEFWPWPSNVSCFYRKWEYKCMHLQNCFSFHGDSILFCSHATSFNYTKVAKKVRTWAPQIHEYNGILRNKLIYVSCWNLGILPSCQIGYGCELRQLHSEKNQFDKNVIRQMWGTTKNRCWEKPAVKGSRRDI